ncbi:heat shock 70 kDa protein 16-like [Silene latifolia]|uniref:heat shock 70 kDa protein 16-like n=1 Tax=Silene latifolia TaxID=37657 RepID=UPI003D785898
MSVIGFDIGNENCVIAAVKQRGIDVLLNDESKRETPAVVSFGEKQRFMGSAGVACATMNPKSTISQIKRLIGRDFDHPDVQKDLRLLPFETSKGRDGGILIHLQYLGERQIFSPVQILAMVFSHLKQIAEKNLDVPVSDCVIGIPCYFNDMQRRLYLDAAYIGGLTPLRLMHDCTATALGYGIYRTDNSSSGQSCVVFVDVGHSDTQVAVVSFKSGYMKILSHAFDSNLGGRDFDEVLFRHFASQFKDRYNIDVYSSARASIRLRAACEKLKKVLSANLEAPLQIECLMDEKDVKGFIRRDEFEKLSESLLDRIVIPCEKALSHSRVPMERIQSVELVGSGSRIPAIGGILASFFRKEPRRTLNASECVARGCALQSAMLSPTFRVKDYEVKDSLPFSIGLTADDGHIQSLRNGVLFPKGHSIPSDELITLRKDDTFQMEVYYANQNELPPGVFSQISLSMIGPLPVPLTEKAMIEVKACLTVHGTVTLESASLVGVDMDEVAMRSNRRMSAERVEDEFDYGYSDAVNGEEDRYSKHSKHAYDSYSHGRKMKTKSRIDIPINEIMFGCMAEEDLVDAQEKEDELAHQDLKVEQAKEKKNSLESYVYDMRNKILSDYQAFATDSEKKGISDNLQQIEDWLYEDGEDESADVYAEILQNLKKIVDPIESRYKDDEVRASATMALLDTIEEHRRAASSLPPREREAALNECAASEQWLQEKTQLQDSLPKNEEPVLWSYDIEREAEDLQMRLNQILKSSASPQPEDDSYSDEISEGDSDMHED